jgi:hypothetical protein
MQAASSESLMHVPIRSHQLMAVEPLTQEEEVEEEDLEVVEMELDSKEMVETAARKTTSWNKTAG